LTKPLFLIVRDGWGIGDPNDEGNAVARAATPNIDRLKAEYPHTRLGCFGPDVGLPEGMQGSSEVGHLNLGAGRVVEQEQVRIDKLIRSGRFFEEPLLLSAMKNAAGDAGALHLMGLVQDQGVHAMDSHLFALLEMAAKNGVKNVFVHAFTDGRDTPPRSAMVYFARLEKEMKRVGLGRIASVMGRYYPMDRDGNWDRVERAFRALIFGEGRVEPSAQSAVESAYARADEAIAEARARGEDVQGVVETDEFIQPTLIVPEGASPVTIRDGDSVVFFNYRQDRAIQLTRAFEEDVFREFDRGEKPRVTFVGFTRYYDEFEHFVLPPMNMSGILGQILGERCLWQLRISETQKFAHVTSFFNSKFQAPFPGEERILIDSPKVPENEAPEMRAPDIGRFCAAAVSRGIKGVRKLVAENTDVHLIRQTGFQEDPSRLEDTYDVFVVNFVNGDMVGHTGDLEAAIIAIEAVDKAVGTVVDAVLAKGGTAIVTADHGNSEQMIDHKTGKPVTSHSLNDVECILVSDRFKKVALRERGVLADVAPTMLQILGIPQPEEMTGKTLIRET